jgi:type II secretion system protein C
MSKKGILMRHPFWFINAFLAALLIAVFFFIAFSWQRLPIKVSFEPALDLKPIKKEISKIDLSKIYTNDLFDTFVQPLPTPKEPDIVSQPIPQPPTPQLPAIPAIPPIKFLEPLKINVRGIIVATDERINIAIIEDAKEGKAKNYKVGDMIEDAQLIRILKNKIILIRSNGQQETIYINQHDAELEQILTPDYNWSSIIKKIADNKYTVDIDLFAERIRNLAQFIDVLNLITVYKQGKSIGCRVGKLEKNSLGLALGLMQGDIIERINNISAADINSRFEIYQSILRMRIGDNISVQLIRKNQSITINYMIDKFEPTRPSADKKQLSQEIKESIIQEEEKKKILEQKYRFAPTIEELQKKEKKDMLNMTRSHERARERNRRGILLNNMNP